MEERPSWRQWGLTLLTTPVGLVAFAAFVGLGGARQSSPEAVALSAITLVYLPPLIAALLAPSMRIGLFGIATAGWSAALLSVVPVYFPGEREDAVATGIGMLTRSAAWEDMAQAVSTPLADGGSSPESLTALRLTAPPGPGAVESSARITLPRLGDQGSDLTVRLRAGIDRLDAVLRRDPGREYTAIRPELLQTLGLSLDNPLVEVTTPTADGDALVPLVLLDGLDLGELALDHVAVVPCMDCPTEVDGWLGDNVLTAFTWEELPEAPAVLVSALSAPNRVADARPFVGVAGRYVRFPGGLVQVKLGIVNRSNALLRDTVVRVECGTHAWLIDLGPLGAGERVFARRRLPEHSRCPAYKAELDGARW